VRQRAEAWLRTAGDAPAAPDQVPERNAQTTTRPTTTGGATTARPPAQPPANRPANTSGAPTQPASIPTVGTYFVQLGAFAEVERAVSLYEEVTTQGVEVRIVRVEGSRFLHVRLGRFVERADAVQELERLAEAGITAALVRDERAESLVRE
jgi:cell division protein FtsN